MCVWWGTQYTRRRGTLFNNVNFNFGRQLVTSSLSSFYLDEIDEEQSIVQKVIFEHIIFKNPYFSEKLKLLYENFTATSENIGNDVVEIWIIVIQWFGPQPSSKLKYLFGCPQFSLRIDHNEAPVQQKSRRQFVPFHV